jgi:hypothetical protein
MENHPFSFLEEHLPDSIKVMLTVISLEAVIALVGSKGGTRFWIPKSLDGHWLADVIGQDEAEKFIAHYSDMEFIPLPRCDKIRLLLRNAAMLNDRRDGFTDSALAIKYKMTERGICKALRSIEKIEMQLSTKLAADWRQGDLFGGL